MSEQHSRAGKVTSSGIVAIVGYGVRDMTELEKLNRPKSGTGSKTTKIEDENTFSEAGLTYLEECVMERRLQLPLEQEQFSKSTSWGHLCEKYVMQNHELMGLEYTQRPDESIVHPEYNFWTGRPDAEKTKDSTVSDVKSPWTRKSFCQLVQPLYDGLTGLDAMNAVRNGYTDGNGIAHKPHKEGNTYYWQLVSNSILTKAKYAELIVFMPYEREIDDIKRIANQSEGEDLNKYYGIVMSENSALPYLVEGGYYKNINRIVFEVPEWDKQLLKQRVQLASYYFSKAGV